MNKRNKYNIVVTLCILLSFLTINLGSIGNNVSKNTNNIETKIDYDNPQQVIDVNKSTTIRSETDKVDEHDLLVLAVAIINVIVITSLSVTIFNILMRKYKIKELPDYLIGIVVLISIIFFCLVYLKMNNSNNALILIASIDVFAFLSDTFFLKSKLKELTEKNDKKPLKDIENLSGYTDITLGQASEFGINNVISLKQDIFNICNNINKAYSEYNIDEIKKLCTKELYETYKKEIAELKKNDEKWIVEKLNYNNCKITSIEKVEDRLIIRAVLRVSLIDYILKDNKIIKGSKNLTNNTYELELEKSAIIRKLLKCPNCGQSLKTTGSDKCPYCKQIIVSIGDDLLLRNKKKIKNK